MDTATNQDIWTDFSCTTLDGLTVRGRDYGDRLSPHLPVVCLPGLSRSSRDFHDIAIAISQHPETPRRVLCLDMRGRGRSDYDKSGDTYTPLIEAGDVLNAIVAAGMQDVIFFGTSRGGIISMLLGSMRPGIIAGVVLHDIGPTIDVTGLVKIKSYLTRMPIPKDWQDAASILRTVHKGSFPEYDDADWQRAARLTFTEENGKPVVDFDQSLLKTLNDVSPDSEPISLWPQFMSLRSKPLLVIRGGLSDLLSAETVETMDRAHPTMRSITVPNEGHVPGLGSKAARNAIFSLLKESDEHAHA